MRHLPTVIRQVRRSSQQAILFVLCVGLSLTTLTAFSGFATSVERALLKDARSLHAADIIIRSYDPISAPLEQAVDRLTDRKQVQRVAVHEFYSVVRPPDNDASVLSALKVVEPGYPFYGEVLLKSKRPFGKVLTPGTCIVEQTLLDRTGLNLGDRLIVGYTSLTIADVVTAEPDRPLDLFTFGPRVFIHAADLEALGLLATGSRIQRLVLLKTVDPSQLASITAVLKAAAAGDGARIDTYLTARSAVKRFLDTLLFFLKLVGLFILIVAGLGIQSTLTALFKEKQRTIAVMKAVGAGGRYVTAHFVLMILILGSVGTAVGILAGTAVQAGLTWALAPLFPGRLDLAVSWIGIAEAVVLGFVVVALFSYLPLHRLRQMRPVAIFNRHPAIRVSRRPYYVSGILILAFFLALVLWHMRDIRFGLYFFGAVVAIILVSALLSQLLLAVVKRLHIRQLALRQAIKGLFRQGSATRAIMLTLTVSLTVIFSDHLIEKNLTATFVQSFPDDAPNAFFVDIQPDQSDAFSAAIGQPVQLYPIVRARITAVNDQAIDHRREASKRRDNLSRVFNLTYRHTLLDDERLIDGDALFNSTWNEPQVSVMDTVVEMRDMSIGDRIRFNIQGVPLTARISSIRSRDNRSLNPFFYFVFPDEVLSRAPQTLFAALRTDPQQLGSLQTRIVSRFPNISVIDMSQTISVFARLMGRLSQIVRVFSLFSIAAGVLILVSAVFATRAERMMESVYYKVLGAGRHFVIAVFALENLLLGLLSSLLALGLAHAGAWWVCTTRFDIDYQPFLPASALMVTATICLTVAVGMVTSRSILAKKPVVYLREQQNG
jgi:putative ABC transport system permease protein